MQQFLCALSHAALSISDCSWQCKPDSLRIPSSPQKISMDLGCESRRFLCASVSMIDTASLIKLLATSKNGTV